jgi:two-component system response regulator AtoC
MAITILIVDDESHARQYIGEFLLSKGYEVFGVATLTEARNCLNKGVGDVVLLDVSLPDGYGPNLLYETQQMPFRPPIILITAHGDIEMAVDAMKNGAHDFLPKPVQFPRLEQSISRACEVVSMRRELAHLRLGQQQKGGFIVGTTQAMQKLISQAQKAASTTVSVLITGETGTGKEVLAKFIHRLGSRQNKPFIDINCAAIQNTMLESELFGYEAGAFTGADRKKIGLMEVADGGILWLDEISSMSQDIQAKVLRAIEERSFRRVGGTNLIHVDVQILAASNRDLKSMIKDGLFREDLYFRLKVMDLHLPALRERRQDIPELVAHFIKLKNSLLGYNIQDVTPRALQALIGYDWPGNIRELANAVERAMLFCEGSVIDIPHLPGEIVQPG